LELDMKLCPLTIGAGSNVEPIAFIQVLSYGIELQIDRTGPYLHVLEKVGSSSTQKSVYLSGAITPDVWHHVAFDVIFDVRAGSAQITIDGTGPSATASGIRTISDTMTWLRLYIGDYGAGNTPACTTVYDNIALTLS